MTLHITEEELAISVRSVMERVERGDEVIVEGGDHRPLAIIQRPPSGGRHIDECIARAKAFEEKLGYAPTPDPDFWKDVKAGIDADRSPTRNLWDD